MSRLTDEQALGWVRWWVQGARQADASWRLGEAGVSPELRACLQRLGGPWLDQLLGMTSAWPPPPNANLLPLLALDDARWSRGLTLAVAVCAGNQPLALAGLDPADLIWCRRLGKGLQPGCWLPDQWHEGSPFTRGLRLLRAWVGDQVWQRLRLHFVRDAIEEAERLNFEDLPAPRLAALWQAVSWYAITSPPQGLSHVDPSQPDPESSPVAA